MPTLLTSSMSYSECLNVKLDINCTSPIGFPSLIISICYGLIVTKIQKKKSMFMVHDHFDLSGIPAVIMNMMRNSYKTS